MINSCEHLVDFPAEYGYYKKSALEILTMDRYLLILLLLVSTNAFPALIKWEDANGQVHYSDVPPPPNANIKILSKTSGETPKKSGDDSSAGDAPKTMAEREAELKKTKQEKKEAADKAAKQQADTEAKKSYCTSLQQNLRALQEGVRIMEVDASGNRSFLEDEQRQQRISKAQQDLSAHCK